MPVRGRAGTSRALKDALRGEQRRLRAEPSAVEQVCGVGDVLATGTISGPEPDAGGSLLELSQNGKQPVELANDVSRTFLQDGDTVTLRGRGESGGERVELGEVSGIITN